jgi:hypothetical protein
MCAKTEPASSRTCFVDNWLGRFNPSPAKCFTRVDVIGAGGLAFLDISEDSLNRFTEVPGDVVRHRTNCANCRSQLIVRHPEFGRPIAKLIVFMNVEDISSWSNYAISFR